MPMAFDSAPAEAVAMALYPHSDDHGYCYDHDDRDDGIRNDLSCYLNHRQAVACDRISFSCLWLIAIAKPICTREGMISFR